jgi:hypothetical protein
MISMRTALEVFNNAYDLDIMIGEQRNGNKFSIGILRGPNQSGRPVLTSEPFTEDFEEALRRMQTILTTIHETGMREFGDPKSMASQFLNLEGIAIDEAKILSLDLIARIVEELRLHRSASTYKMMAPV